MSAPPRRTETVRTLRSHYDQHLGPIYEWMAGPFDEASQPAALLFEELQLEPQTGVAVDLGCGHGLQAIPLAQRGFHVLAIDLCAELLSSLARRAESLSRGGVQTLQCDLLDFPTHIESKSDSEIDSTVKENVEGRAKGKVDVVVYMGDTLTHLSDCSDVNALLEAVRDALAPGGTFVVSFRDYVTQPLEGDARFIPVRADAMRSLTCFLDYGPETVRVHDLVHEQAGSGLRISSYSKLRLAPETVRAALTRLGLELVLDRTSRGMVTLAARLPASATRLPPSR